jgi:hypothetical protein
MRLTRQNIFERGSDDSGRQQPYRPQPGSFEHYWLQQIPFGEDTTSSTGTGAVESLIARPKAPSDFCRLGG